MDSEKEAKILRRREQDRRRRSLESGEQGEKVRLVRRKRERERERERALRALLCLLQTEIDDSLARKAENWKWPCVGNAGAQMSWIAERIILEIEPKPVSYRNDGRKSERDA